MFSSALGQIDRSRPAFWERRKFIIVSD